MCLQLLYTWSRIDSIVHIKKKSIDCIRLCNNKLVLTKQTNFFFQRLHSFVVPVIDLPLKS